MKTLRVLAVLVLGSFLTACSIGGLSEEKAKRTAEAWVASVHTTGPTVRNYSVQMKWHGLVQDSPTKYHASADFTTTWEWYNGEIWSHPMESGGTFGGTFVFQRAARGGWQMTYEGVSLGPGEPKEENPIVK